jgi:hypothetical protein
VASLIVGDYFRTSLAREQSLTMERMAAFWLCRSRCNISSMMGSYGCIILVLRNLSKNPLGRKLLKIFVRN